ncbi:selenocysteine-specific translation elongation factor [Novosphingobium flavum]|uniref:Selenocysteine-specific elongation factor n=1 Tax=Novosphingobium flavum TaxID=1778672 RepID=A0A7X1FSW9_9SPHN|nr:selenocysteine-specific translation elongation factor [Novosphingobium flavum]MBC2665867.1 selenocysteine-specific translation elongation factor [Novosphingobium flavum]
MLIATAGHIDHGKTSLVRALSGLETDRLPEEKARGISIDLGFAHWRPAGSPPIAFVDVPGHEKFVRNMLAGVGGVDFALVVVAADDGIMPQTIEHLRILDLLGIARAIVALTKIDRVEPDRVAEVAAEVEALLAGTTMAGAPVFPVASPSGAGIPELAAALIAAAAEQAPLRAGLFRLGIDKFFTVTGAGTVATGTVLSGTVTTGDQLMLSPRGRQVRVRGLQSAGEAATSVGAGQRCALNLSGVEVDDLHRGDWLVAPALHAPTTRIEALVRLAPEREAPLRHATPVHLHIGTAAIPGRVLLRRQSPIQPGGEAAARIVLDHPTLCVTGERFVLRDQSGRELIGGGRVLDPYAPARRPRGQDREGVLAALATFDPVTALERLLALPGLEIDRTWFERCFALEPDQAETLYALCEAEAVGRDHATLIGTARLAALGEAVTALLGAWHGEHPESGGMTLREIRLRLTPPVSADLAAALIRRLTAAGQVAQSGPLIRLPHHVPRFSAAETALWQELVDVFGERRPQQISIPDLARELRSTEGAVRTLLYRRRLNGDVWSIADGRFMLREHVAALAASAARLAADHPEGFSAAQFRDATGIGRNLVIRVLEFFDRIGITGRRGDVRVMRPDYETIVGEAQPVVPEK